MAWLEAFVAHNESEVVALSSLPISLEGSVLGPDEVQTRCGANAEGILAKTVDDRPALHLALKCLWTERALSTLGEGLSSAKVDVDEGEPNGNVVTVRTDDQNGMTYDARLTIKGGLVNAARIQMHFEH